MNRTALARLLSMSAVAGVAAAGVSSSVSAAPLDALIAAAKQEGQLTVIALPHDWCNYGELVAGFQKKYGIKINELNPDAGSGDEVEAIKANKGNKGPQAPDVIDVGLSFGPQAKAEGLLQPYKVADVELDSERVEGCRRLLVWRLLRRAGVRSQRRHDRQGAVRLERPAQVRLQERRRAGGRPALGQPGDPGRVRRRSFAKQGRREQGRTGRPDVFRQPEQERQLRAGDRQGRVARARHHTDRRALGLQRAGRPRHAERQPEGECRDSEDGRGRRRVRSGDQRLRAASERSQAVDGIPVLRRRPDRLAEGLLPPDALQRAGDRQESAASAARQVAAAVGLQERGVPDALATGRVQGDHHEALGRSGRRERQVRRSA